MKKTLPLTDKVTIPKMGFGTWQIKGAVCYQSVATALEVGYRHIDTAHVYHNHTQVGKAIRESSIERSQLFVTSKLWIDEFQQPSVRPALERALSELQLDYLDLYLMHWPNKAVPVKATLTELNKAQNEGLIKTVGVSNFTIRHLEKVLETGIPIVNNQVEFHPSLYQQELLSFCQNNKIALTAYSPLAQGQDLQLPLIQELAQKYDRDHSQIILNWLLQKDIITIPRSTSQEHIKSNFQALDFDLTSEEISAIDGLDTHNRLLNPNFAEFDE